MVQSCIVIIMLSGMHARSSTAGAKVVSVLSSLVLFQATSAAGQETQTRDPVCKVIPGDAAWPSTDAWSQLNQTVGGRLIATIPQAAVCYQTGYASVQANQTACTELAENWDYPQT